MLPLVGIGHVHCGRGGVQVVVKQAGQGFTTSWWGVVVDGPVNSIGAYQVVECVPAGGRIL